ncbi:Rieske 2Fe-2S domain-containing protein [Halobellus sp. GM3]|uniref:Rieske 2Fe-2S domain-containing protein n=1 Tax=Halobellus sp. GM3 TaxID=3458410 RepID=UPI00403E02EB
MSHEESYDSSSASLGGDGPDSSPSLREFLESGDEVVQEGLVPLKAYNDAEVFELERERIFGQCWVFLGHGSEIPDPGDYASRYIGTDPFIMTRDEAGDIRVLFNSCRHKGAKVCRTEQGNSSHFRCPYHGWTYKNDGDLIGVPNRDLLHGESELWTDIGLKQAPRVDDYNGLIFASLDRDAPPLEEFLGPATWYLDLFTKGFKGGMEVLGEPHRVEIDSDWKSGSDNFFGDAHHTEVAHQSLLEIGMAEPEAVQYSQELKQVVDRVNVSHAGPAAGTFRIHKQAPEIYLGQDPAYMSGEELTEEQQEALSRMMIYVGSVFPNLSFIFTPDTGAPGEPGATASIRQWQPLGPGKAEMWSWVVAPADAPDSYKEEIHKATTSTFSPSGNFEQDDLAVWETIADVADSTFASKEDLQLNYKGGWQVGNISPRDDDWYGPGVAWDDVVTDVSSYAFHQNWYHKMLQKDGWASCPDVGDGNGGDER